jgi:hypothetical protein
MLPSDLCKGSLHTDVVFAEKILTSSLCSADAVNYHSHQFEKKHTVVGSMAQKEKAHITSM